MLRSRDIMAMIMALALSRMAWDNSTESLSAFASLAFYFPRSKGMKLSPMDVDGDGTSEALAIIQQSSSASGSPWVLQILDLKPLHQFRKSILAPFEPTVLFSSSEITEHENAVPMKLSTGQVLIKKIHGDPDKKKKKIEIPPDKQITDQTRKYFCGIDWHDASQKCATPCPGGQSDECPADERCFADTPCDIFEQNANKEDSQIMFELTPGGGLPSLVTLWSNGAMTLHSLTNDKTLGEATAEDPTNKKKSRKKKPLELRQMWHVKLFPQSVPVNEMIWEEANVLFLDAYSSEEAMAEHGIIVVSGSYINRESVDSSLSSFILAVDAMKGTVLWDSFSDEEKNGDKPLPLPVQRGWTSMARRRSKIATIQDQGPSADGENIPSCLHVLKRHIREVLPYSYWDPEDSSLSAIHLDLRKKHREEQTNHVARVATKEQHGAGGATPAHQQKKKWHHRFHKKTSTLDFGRPNVIVSHTHGGLQVRSLRNGKALCHLSLLEQTVYSDFNNDGIIDQVQILLESTKIDPNDKWVTELVSKLQARRDMLGDQGAKKQLLESNPNLCHAMALSGLPTREELFSTNICGGKNERMGDHPSVSLDSVAPLVVESLSGRKKTRDFVVALNNGMVHRIHGGSGRKQWSLVGKHNNDFPIWEEGSHTALLTRIQSSNVPTALSPVLLAGENSLAVLSVKNGNVLASALYPQTSTSRPLLAEVSGDGTADVVILSADGVWGFQIGVYPGSAVVLRVMVGLLLMLLMLAVLRNRYGGKRDKRATDA